MSNTKSKQSTENKAKAKKNAKRSKVKLKTKILGYNSCESKTNDMS